MSNILKLFIKEEIRRILREQADLSKNTTEEPETEEPGPDTTSIDTTEDQTEDNATDSVGDTENTGDDITGDLTGNVGGETEQDIDMGDDVEEGAADFGSFGGGGGGGLGGGGGGGGFGGFGDDDTDSDMTGDKESPGLTPPAKPEKRPEDPVGAALSEAEKAAKLTVDPQAILNAIKSSIQVNFADINDAWPVVKELRKTKDKTLNNVADRLTLFLAGIS